MTSEDINPITEVKAEAAIALACAYLQYLHDEQRYPVDEYGLPVGYESPDTSPAGEVARRWSRALLGASEANGLAGCRLCRG